MNTNTALRRAPLGLAALAVLAALGLAVLGLAALRGGPYASQPPSSGASPEGQASLSTGQAAKDGMAGQSESSSGSEPSMTTEQSAKAVLAPSSSPAAAFNESLAAESDAAAQSDPESWPSRVYRGSTKDAPAWFRIRHPEGWSIDWASTAAGPSLQSIPFDPVPSEPLWARLSIQRGGRAQSLAGDPAAEPIQIAGLPALRSEQIDDWGMRQILVSIEDGDSRYSLAASLSTAAEDAEALALGERLDAIIASFEPIAWRLDAVAFEERLLEGALAGGSGLALRLPAGWQATRHAGVVSLVGEIGEGGAAGASAGGITIRIAPGDAADAAAWGTAEPLEYQVFRRPGRSLESEPGATSRSLLVGPGGAWRVDLSLPALAEGSAQWWLQEQTVWAILVDADLLEASAE